MKVLATGGQTGYRTVGSTRGSWSSMTLLAAVNDVTGDGKGDVLGRIGDGVTKIYRGDGAGHVSTTGIAATTAFRRANKVVAAGDFNGDRRNDVLMRQWSNGGLYLVPGIGGGAFGKPRLLGLGWTKYTFIAVPGDLTGDGRPDVVGVKDGAPVRVPQRGWLAHPVGRLAPDRGHGVQRGPGLGSRRDRRRRRRPAGARTQQRRAGHPHGPHRQDPGRHLGMFGGASRWTRVSAAQMTGSPQADLVGVGPAGQQLVVMANNGLKNVESLTSTNITNSGLSMVLNAGDWNRDGKPDLIARDASKDRLYLYAGLGGGRYKGGALMSAGWKTFVNIVGVGDVTGDGRPDLMGRVNGGPMTIFPGAGSTKFQAPILAPSSMRTFNLVGSGSWKPASMPGSSIYGPGGAFVPFIGTGGRIPKPYNWVVGPGDVDGDGRPDLVARDSAGMLWLLPGTTSGYGARRYLAPGFAAYAFIG